MQYEATPVGPGPPSGSLNRSGGLFPHAHDFTIHNSNLYDYGRQINYNSYYATNTSVLERLAGYAMLGAAFDSSDRDPPPRCHPGTRMNIVQGLQTVLRGPLEAKLIWLYGSAGVGKSAIMQTLAEGEDGNTLGASLFFSRANKRDSPQKVLTTISYQFSIINSPYQVHIAQQLAAHPTFLDKPISTQFENLIAKPFAQQGFLTSSQGRVILLDGLDELHDIREQCRIIELINKFILQHPTLPLVWVIASRSEPHLQVAFSRARNLLTERYSEYQVLISSDEGVQDVEHYLRDEFARIQQSYPDSISPHQVWPAKAQFIRISSVASGFFLFASVVIRFIEDPNYGNPVSRLNLILFLLDKRSTKPGLETNPFEVLDMLYEQIMAEVPRNVLPTTRLILGYTAIQTHYLRNVGILHVCNILGLERHVFYGALRKLYSVLTFPEPGRADRDDIRFLHVSFSDYLQNRERSHVYSLDLIDTATYLWRQYMKVLQQWMNGHSYGENIELSWPSKEEDSTLYCEAMEAGGPTVLWTPSEIRSSVVRVAGESWPAILWESFTPVEKPSPFRLQLPLQELSAHVEELDLSRAESFGFHFLRLRTFAEWLNSEGPMELRDAIVRNVPLAMLDIRRFVKSLFERRWFGLLTDEYHFDFTENIVEGYANTQGINFQDEWQKMAEYIRNSNESVAELLHLMGEEEAHTTVVTILGHPPRCSASLTHYRDGSSYVWVFPYI